MFLCEKSYSLVSNYHNLTLATDQHTTTGQHRLSLIHSIFDNLIGINIKMMVDIWKEILELLVWNMKNYRMMMIHIMVKFEAGHSWPWV